MPFQKYMLIKLLSIFHLLCFDDESFFLMIIFRLIIKKSKTQLNYYTLYSIQVTNILKQGHVYIKIFFFLICSIYPSKKYQT